MANVLDREKQVAVISTLAEGSDIRQIERITGVSGQHCMGGHCGSVRDSRSSESAKGLRMGA